MGPFPRRSASVAQGPRHVGEHMRARHIVQLVLVVAAAIALWARAGAPPSDTGRIQDLHAAHASGVWVTATGRVIRVLTDDNQGDRQ